jgi:NADH-quinone oxidoreductase subunit K
MIPVTHFLYLASALFIIGLLGVLFRRERAILLLSAQMMIAAGVLVLVAGSRYWAGQDGQSMGMLVTLAGLAQAAVIAAMLSATRFVAGGSDRGTANSEGGSD